MGKDRPLNYSRSSRDKESSRRRDERSEYRSMTRSPSPMGKSSKSSRKKYSRSSSSSSSSSSGNDRRSRRKEKKLGSSTPIVLQSSPERETVARSKWLESSPNFQPMTPPSPPSPGPPSAPVPPMESQPIPSFQRENYRSSDAPSRGFPRGFSDGFNQGYGNNYFQGGNTMFHQPDANSQHEFNMGNLPPQSSMGHGPPMVGVGPPPNMVGGMPPPNLVGSGPPPNMVGAGPPLMGGGPPGPNVARSGTPNVSAPWEPPHGNYPFTNTEYPPPTTGVQPPLLGPNRPLDVSHPHPVPSSSNLDSPKPNAVEQELVQQKRTLAIQREEYFKKKISFTRDLKALKDKKRELQKDPPSKGSDRFLKENSKLQDEIEQKLKSLDSVIEMLTHIIGDKDEIEQLLRETSHRSESPQKRKRSRSKSPSRSKSVKKRSSSPRKRSSSPHVNVIHYDPELHWCSVCNVFPRSATVYLVHLHSDQHKKAVKDKKEKEKPEEEFFPWRVHEKRELSPPVYKNASSRRVPIRGVPFLVPSTAWYCSMCKMWLGDLEIANRHLRGEKHAATYGDYVTHNPHWEVDWLRDRTRAYERNSEARTRQEDDNEEKSKKSSKKTDLPEHSGADVSKLEKRLMALISANNAASSKEGSSKDKSRRRSSSRSDASYSDTSDEEEKKERKKKKKSKKKKKHLREESKEKSAEQDDHKKEKHKDQEDEPEGKGRKRWDDVGAKDKRNNEKERGPQGERKHLKGSDRPHRDDELDRGDPRNRGLNSWRGRGRPHDRSRFDGRRLINRTPLWRPSAKDRIGQPWDVKEKLAAGRNVFGLAASEYYGPEAPPKKDSDKK